MVPAAPTIGVLDLDDALAARLAATYSVVAWSGHRDANGSPPSIVISTFGDDAALLSGTAGADGLIASLADGALHVTTALHGRAAIEHVSREHERRRQRFIAAPILLASGVPDHPAAVLGGAAEAIASVAPVFQAMDVSVAMTCERPADAALLAVTHAAMLGCAIAAIAEAFALVRTYGVDPAVMRDVMADALFAGSVYGPIADAMLTRVDSGAPSAARGVEILDLAFAAANSAHVPLPGVDACRDRLLSAAARGDGARPWTVAGSS